MGRIGFNRGQLISEISESVGFKSGLSFSYERMLEFVSHWSKKILMDNAVSCVGVRAEEYEELYFDVLQGTGYIPSSVSPAVRTGLFSLDLLKRYSNDKHKLDMGLKIYELYGKWMMSELEELIQRGDIKYGMVISPEPYLQECRRQFGTFGYMLALEVLTNQAEHQKYSPWYNVRRVEWVNTAELEELFNSESLETYYGSFIDQRYIDYLSNHLDDIGEIHWRKFEGLTGEFFKRNGYEVTLGKGRNDGGIDIRVWKEKEDKENPPMILIQCKRQKEKVQREIVKALWADVIYEKAESGLIVTSSEVSSGAKEDCKVRGYNVNFAERENLKKWIRSMRSKDIEIIV